MAASSSGALKAYIEGLGLGISAYRDKAPPGKAAPYVVIIESIAMVPDPHESTDPDTPTYQTGRETVQVDVWETWRAVGTPGSPGPQTESESYTLAPAIYSGLHGARIVPIGGHGIYTVLVRNKVRLLELDNNLVHHAITAVVFRQF